VSPGRFKSYILKQLKRILERVWHFLPAFFWGTTIFVLSTTGNIQLPEVSFLESDKLGHFAAYGLLTFLVLTGFSRQGVVTRSKIAGSILFCCFYGVLLEIVQYTFFPNRYFELYDALANAVGSVAGYFVFRQLNK